MMYPHKGALARVTLNTNYPGFVFRSWGYTCYKHGRSISGSTDAREGDLIVKVVGHVVKQRKPKPFEIGKEYVASNAVRFTFQGALPDGRLTWSHPDHHKSRLYVTNADGSSIPEPSYGVHLPSVPMEYKEELIVERHDD